MNILPLHHVAAAQRANLEFLRGMSHAIDLTGQLFSHFEKVTEWNFRWVHALLPGASECAKQILEMNRPQDVLTMQIQLIQLASGQAIHASRDLPSGNSPMGCGR
ncbi:phasin family protein [Cupriavidus pinatubonensis]|uniref:phasin family protein n=1 Tax=Cupriavidus pinatubonensis TaxID=248026 RepID=UPI003615C5D9